MKTKPLFTGSSGTADLEDDDFGATARDDDELDLRLDESDKEPEATTEEREFNSTFCYVHIY